MVGFLEVQPGFLQPLLTQTWVKCTSLDSSRRVVYSGIRFLRTMGQWLLPSYAGSCKYLHAIKSCAPAGYGIVAQTFVLLGCFYKLVLVVASCPLFEEITPF